MHVCMSIHPEGESCSDLGLSACSQRPFLPLPGRWLIENKHSTDVESTDRIRASVCVCAFTLMVGLRVML